MPVCFELATASARGDHAIPAVAASLENAENRDQCISPPRIRCLPTACQPPCPVVRTQDLTLCATVAFKQVNTSRGWIFKAC